MALTLAEQVRTLRRGDHVCLLYESVDEQMTAVAPFIDVGLKKNDLCVFAGDSATRDLLARRLTALGVDVGAAVADGRLRLLDPQAVYLPTGTFRPSDTVAALRAMLTEAKERGFAGLRTAGDMSWILHGPPGSDRTIEYEREINGLLAESPFLGMCQYDRCRFEPARIREVLRVHPIAVLGDKVCSNPYYEPHDGVEGDAARQLQWMIGRLEQTRAVELGLQQLNRELEDMVHAASHDLQEPARMVRLHLDLIARCAERLDERGRGWLEQARRSAQRLGDLVTGILDMPHQAHEAEVADVALDEVVAQALEALGPAIAECGAEVSVGGLPTVRGDRALLIRLFLNLLGNAIKFRRGPPRIAIEVASSSDRHVIAVRDNGIGIPQQWLSEVFGMFKRLHARDAYPGHGIGLATCRRIVELHHGDLWVESREGEGSAFFIALPRAPA